MNRLIELGEVYGLGVDIFATKRHAVVQVSQGPYSADDVPAVYEMFSGPSVDACLRNAVKWARAKGVNPAWDLVTGQALR